MLRGVVVAVLVVASSCQPTPPPRGWEEPYLTRSNGDVVQVSVTSSGSVRFSAPGTNIETNTRVLLDHIDTPLSNDQTVCSTAWSDRGWPSQEGVAGRILIQGDRTRAVTVNKNVWNRGTWIYVVHLWDTNTPEVFHLVGSFDMSAVIGPSDSVSPASARRLCMRLRGRVLTFKVWRAQEPEPPWADTTHVRTVLLPREALHSGRPGWYSGHLPPGSNQFVSGMSTSNDDPPGTPLVK